MAINNAILEFQVPLPGFGTFEVTPDSSGIPELGTTATTGTYFFSEWLAVFSAGLNAALAGSSADLVNERVVITLPEVATVDFTPTDLDHTVFGFASAILTGSTTYTAPNPPKFRWDSGRGYDRDSLLQPRVIGSVSQAISGLTHASRIVTTKRRRTLSIPLVPESKVFGSTGTFEAFWLSHLTAGALVKTLGASYRLGSFDDPWSREGRGNGIFWRLDLDLVEA